LATVALAQQRKERRNELEEVVDMGERAEGTSADKN
jgi:hypothetical protein